MIKSKTNSIRISILASLIITYLYLPASWSAPSDTILELSEAHYRALDEYIETEIASRNVPGAVFVLVHDGEVRHRSGHGYAEIDEQIPMDPDKTFLDVQSVSKVVTVSVVMCAVDEGLVSLDTDINEYLTGFKLEDPFGVPITLRHLLTHTSGIAQRGMGIVAVREDDVIPLGAFLENLVNPPVFPPDTRLYYTDLGICLAAYVVECAAKVPYNDYARSRLLEPLDMTHSHFFKLPEDSAAGLAQGYSYENGKQVPVVHDYYNIWPSSSLLTTGPELMKFALMHLQNGRYGEKQILSEKSTIATHTKQFCFHEKVRGICLDFFEHFENEQRLIKHSGWGSGFTSELVLVPEHGLAYFLAVNSLDGSLIPAFQSHFLDEVFPVTSVKERPEEISLENLSEFEGWYRNIERDPRALEKIEALLTGYISVTKTSTGRLRIGDLEFVPEDALLFRHDREDESEYALFERGSNGNVSTIFMQHWSYERMPMYLSQPVQLAVLAIALLTFASVCMCWPIIWFRNRRTNTPKTTYALWWGVFVSSGAIVSTVLLAQILGRLEYPSELTIFQRGIPTDMQVVLVLLKVFAFAGLSLLPIAIVQWKRKVVSVSWKLHYTFTGLIAIVFIAFLIEWNLL